MVHDSADLGEWEAARACDRIISRVQGERPPGRARQPNLGRTITCLKLCRAIPSWFPQMLPYTPSAPGSPPPALESSVLSWLTMPVLDAMTLTLQYCVLAKPLPRSVLMFVWFPSCQIYDVSPLFILNVLAGGPNLITRTSTFCPMY